MGASYYVFSVEFDAKSAAVKWIACAHVPSVIYEKRKLFEDYGYGLM
jgi:hypothetical protein